MKSNNSNTDILDKFIAAFKDEFKDENWDYLDFIADRVRAKEDTTNTGGKWKVEYCLDQSIFINEGDTPIAMLQSEEDNGITPEMEANAQRIVNCVNNHDALVSALQELWQHTKLNDRDAATGNYHPESLFGKVAKAVNNINQL